MTRLRVELKFDMEIDDAAERSLEGDDEDLCDLVVNGCMKSIWAVHPSMAYSRLICLVADDVEKRGDVVMCSDCTIISNP